MNLPIITKNTDQKKVKYGYCWKCFSYLELWRKDNTSTCPYCKTKLIHIPNILLIILLVMGCFLLIWCV